MGPSKLNSHQNSIEGGMDDIIECVEKIDNDGIKYCVDEKTNDIYFRSEHDDEYRCIRTCTSICMYGCVYRETERDREREREVEEETQGAGFVYTLHIAQVSISSTNLGRHASPFLIYRA